MLIHIQKTIQDLKEKVKKNVDKINDNQNVIKQLLRNELDGGSSSDQYEAYYSENRKLLNQNNDLINVQLTLINFIEKYKDTAILSNKTPVMNVFSISDSQEVFALTIKNILPFDYEHPYYKEASFIDKLIGHYKSMEDYEKCQELLRLREKSLS